MEFLLIIIIILAGFVILGVLISKKDSKKDFLELITYFDNNTKKDRVEFITTLSLLKKDIGEITEIGRSMKDLQQFVLSPKLRGNVGEHVLKEMLGQSLPKSSFHLQYAFASGEKVDAAIKTGAGIIPVDAKFPMENFNRYINEEEKAKKEFYRKNFERDIKGHIESISKKYILVSEGTLDYALMYIPSESVYYEVVNSPDIFEFATKKRVLPVSPTTFYAYLKAILLSLEGQKIESRAKEILKLLSSIQADFDKTNENLNILQKHITNAANSINSLAHNFRQLGTKIDRTKSLDLDDKNKLPN